MTEPASFHLTGTLWLNQGEQGLADASRIALLEKIAESGSIARAAKAAGMSYRAAWDAIGVMNELSGGALVETATGGKGGGGARLTERGRRLVQVFRRLEGEHRKFLDVLGQGIEDFDQYLGLLGRLFLRTSARNQFHGRVACLRTGPVTAEVELAIGGDDRIVALITRESAEGLGLRIGTPAWALIKAPWVMLAAEQPAFRTSARNRLVGTVERITDGPVDCEVVLRLDGGTALSAVITPDSARTLDLAEGRRACAFFKASSVIIGMAG